MTKLQFLLALHDKLSGLPREDVEERLNFYSEMIEDRMEEGHSEEEAVAAVGSVEELAAQIIADIPLNKIAKEKMKTKRKLSVWEIVLLVLGSPIWLSLLIAAFAVALSVYVVLWAMVISLWAVDVSLWACALAGIVGMAFAFGGNVLTGIAMLAAGLVCAGLAIFLLYGCKLATTGTILLTEKVVLGVKNWFIKKEEAA